MCVVDKESESTLLTAHPCDRVLPLQPGLRKPSLFDRVQTFSLVGRVFPCSPLSLFGSLFLHAGGPHVSEDCSLI